MLTASDSAASPQEQQPQAEAAGGGRLILAPCAGAAPLSIAQLLSPPGLFRWMRGGGGFRIGFGSEGEVVGAAWSGAERRSAREGEGPPWLMVCMLWLVAVH